MILSYRHKGLADLAATARSAKVRTDLWRRVLRRLDALAAAKTPEALRVPGFDFHPLLGLPQRYSLHDDGPWCITFGWTGENAVEVDLENYHQEGCMMTMPGRCPTHPGEILREDSLPALGLSVAAFARALGVSRQMVHGLLAERSAVSPEMAVRLGAFFGNGPQLWLDMQSRRDLWLAEQRLADRLPKHYEVRPS